ncbi:MAG: PAS domain S-box protein [Campylobacterales bacterium]|nr:PAS domain S-box protein [Campylobacterales bacterium]
MKYHFAQRFIDRLQSKGFIGSQGELTLDKQQLFEEIAHYQEEQIVSHEEHEKLYYDAPIAKEMLRYSDNAMQESIAKEQQLVQNIFDMANAIIAIIQPDGTMIRLNRYALEFIGYTQEEIASKPYFWTRFLPDTIRQKVVQEVFEQAKMSSTQTHYQNSWISKSGEERMFEWSNTMVKKPDGSLDYIFSIGIDITAQIRLNKEMQKAKIKFHALFEESYDSVALVDFKTMKFIDTNRQFHQMYGYTKEDLEHIRIEDIVANETPQKVKERTREILQKGYETFISQHRLKSGQVIDVSVHIKVIVLEGEQLFYVSFHDITQELRLNQSIIDAKEMAERANKAKSEFLANMSHEIRTPLNGIIGLTEIVLKSKLEPLQREYLSKAQNASYALLHILNDILDYSKIEAGKVEIQKRNFKLSTLLKKNSDLFGYKAHQKGIELFYDIGPMIPDRLKGDDFRIIQVLNNLVGNAVKFTNQGFVKLILKLLHRSNNKITIKFSVQDSGIGISHNNQRRLFEAFEQADASTTKRYEGTGLGLMISKQLVELMGGEFFYHSKEKLGSTFGFHLELETYFSHEFPNQHFLADKEILILSKNHYDTNYLKQTLNLWGASVESVSQMKDALAKVKDSTFSHIFIVWECCKEQESELYSYLETLDEVVSILLVPSYYKETLLQNSQILNRLFNIILEKPYTSSNLYAIFTKNKSDMQSIVTQPVGLRLKSPKRLLLVEDHETNRLVASLMLKEYGFIIDNAHDGEEATMKAKANRYDIIFMDIQMPVMDGFEATRVIRRFDKDTPIIALSAAVMQEDIEKAQKVGMNAHLAKPMNHTKVEKILQEYFTLEPLLDQSESIERVEDELIKGVDMVTLQHQLQIERHDLYRLYENFYSHYYPQLHTFENLQSKELKAFVHKLKGSSGNLKIKPLYELCEEIEHSGITSVSIELLQMRLEEMLQAIQREILPQIESVSSLQKSRDEVKVMLDEIVTKLENAHYLSRNTIVALSNNLQGVIDKDDNEAIVKYYDEFNDEKLEALLKSIQTNLYQ